MPHPLDMEISEARSVIVIHGGPEVVGPVANNDCSVQYEFLLSTLDKLCASGAIHPCDSCEAYHLTKDHKFTAEEVETLMRGDV